MKIISTGTQIGKTLRSAGRLRAIVSVFVKHGFQNVVENVRLGRFATKQASADVEKYTPAERLRMAFEELGPTFIKLGQLLASRPDLVPEDFIREFKKLHDQVDPEDFSTMKEVLTKHFKTSLNDIFLSIEEEPLGSASIAQVYRAVLKDHTKVVIKVQRPGIHRVIQEDLGVLQLLASLLDRYIPESRLFNPIGLVDEFSRSLQLETNFIVEANNIKRFQANFSGDPVIRIPHIYTKLSGPRVLVMEYFDGIPLSHKNALDQPGIEVEKLAKHGLMAFFRMVFKHAFFHGDLHAGNLIILPDNKLGLIDFGLVGRLSRRTQDAIAGIFFALANEDYEQLAYEYLEISPTQDFIDPNEFARDLRNLLGPYFGLTMKDVNVGKLLLSSASIAAKHKLRIPSELMLLFKSLVNIESMGHLLVDDFDVLTYTMEFASELVKTKYDPAKVTKDLSRLMKESTSLISILPRQLKLFLRNINSKDHAWNIHVEEMDDLRRSIESSSNLLFLGLIIGSLLLSSSALVFQNEPHTVFGVPTLSTIGYGLALLLSMVAFFNYIKK